MAGNTSKRVAVVRGREGPEVLGKISAGQASSGGAGAAENEAGLGRWVLNSNILRVSYYRREGQYAGCPPPAAPVAQCSRRCRRSVRCPTPHGSGRLTDRPDQSSGVRLSVSLSRSECRNPVVGTRVYVARCRA